MEAAGDVKRTGAVIKTPFFQGGLVRSHLKKIVTAARRHGFIRMLQNQYKENAQ
jgi:hypothetical protein